MNFSRGKNRALFEFYNFLKFEETVIKFTIRYLNHIFVSAFCYFSGLDLQEA
jgi:hypothetical protein